MKKVLIALSGASILLSTSFVIQAAEFSACAKFGMLCTLQTFPRLLRGQIWFPKAMPMGPDF